MPFPFLGLAICAVCGWGCKKAHDIYKQNQKTKRDKYSLKGKNIDLERENIKKFQDEKEEWKKKYDELDDRIKKRDEEVKKYQTKLRDPNLSTDERNKINSQLALLLAQQEDDKKEKDDVSSKLKKLDENIKNSQNIISSTLSNLDEKHWIKEFLTLENLLIAVGCYVVYQLLKEEKR